MGGGRACYDQVGRRISRDSTARIESPRSKPGGGEGDPRAGPRSRPPPRRRGWQEVPSVVGMRQLGGGRLATPVDDGVEVAGGKAVGRPCVELPRPRRDLRRRSVEVHRGEVVGHPAAAQDEHPFAPQWRERPPEREDARFGPVGVCDLEHGDFGIREHVAQGHPRRVIHPVARAPLDGLAGHRGVKERFDACREGTARRCRVRHAGGESGGERAGEVGPGDAASGGSEGEVTLAPVGGHHEHPPGPGQAGSPGRRAEGHARDRVAIIGPPWLTQADRHRGPVGRAGTPARARPAPIPAAAPRTSRRAITATSGGNRSRRSCACSSAEQVRHRGRHFVPHEDHLRRSLVGHVRGIERWQAAWGIA